MARTQTKPSMREAVRQAMGVLGMDALPADLHNHLKEKMGLDISPNMISSYKSSLRREAGLKGLRKKKKKKQRATAVAAAPAGQPSAAPVSDGITLKELRALKDMAVRLGAGRFREVVEFLCP
jgi:hypothetical protein